MELDSLDNKVSVVIPIYNSEKFLKDSIESVSNQTYKNLEIIAVNDGSTDKSLEILQQYSGQINIISQTNQGLASALNSGIKKITGQWFKWFSPDDMLNPDAIEVLVEEAKKLPQNTIVYSNWDIIDKNNKKLRSFHESNYNNLSKFDFNVRMLDKQQINVNTSLIPTSLLGKGFAARTLSDPVATDYDFLLRAGILYDAKFHLVEKALIKYRVRPDQLSHKNIAKTLSYLSEVRRKILSKIEKEKSVQYLSALKEYKKRKPLGKKIMELGLKLVTNTLPVSVSDHLIVFYLREIRQTR